MGLCVGADVCVEVWRPVPPESADEVIRGIVCDPTLRSVAALAEVLAGCLVPATNAPG
jgi:hypothetical protein